MHRQSVNDRQAQRQLLPIIAAIRAEKDLAFFQLEVARSFAAGACVTTPRHQVDVIVTEFGAAELAGLTTSARAAALVEIAHPAFRELLRKGDIELPALESID